MTVLSQTRLAEAVDVHYLSQNNIEDILQRHAEFDRCLWNKSTPLGMYTIMDINELKTTCKNPLCRSANPSGKFHSGKLNSDWKTDNTREQMVKPVWISLNKSFAAAPLLLFSLYLSFIRECTCMCCISRRSVRDRILVHKLSAKNKAVFSFLSPYVGRDVESAECRNIYYVESFDSNTHGKETLLLRAINLFLNHSCAINFQFPLSLP